MLPYQYQFMRTTRSVLDILFKYSIIYYICICIYIYVVELMYGYTCTYVYMYRLIFGIQRIKQVFFSFKLQNEVKYGGE